MLIRRLILFALLLAASTAGAGTVSIGVGAGDCRPQAVGAVSYGAAPTCLTATATPTSTATPTATSTPTPSPTAIALPLSLANGGTHADLSGTGGTSQVLKQVSAGADITVARLACADLSNAAASCSTDTTVATNISSGTLPAGRLPNPSSSTLGGIQSYAAVSNQWINAISTSGVPSSTQPAAANLSDGTTGSGAVCLATSPTITTPTISTQSSAAGANEALSSTAPAQTASAQAGTSVTITASDAVAGSSNAGAAAGGGVSLIAKAAKRLTSGNANGGDVVLSADAGIGTGTRGGVVINNPNGLGYTTASAGIPLTIDGINNSMFIKMVSASGNTASIGEISGVFGVYPMGTLAFEIGAAGGANSYIITQSDTTFRWHSGTNLASGADDLFLRRRGAANLGIGDADAASPVAQTVTAQGSRGGTDTNTAGASITYAPGPGTGSAAGTKYAVQRNLMRATGTTAQAQADAFVVCESKTLSNTSATTTLLATIGAASNTAGSFEVLASVACDDGTNFDSDTIRCTQAWVNKAGTITFGAQQCSTSVAANNSGSCTVAPTFTAGSSVINLNVTPVITTIAPTTTTAMLTVTSHSAGAVTCQ